MVSIKPVSYTHLQPDEEIADLSAEETDEETVDLSTEEKAAEEVSDISEEKTSEADDFDIVTADTIDLGKVVTEQALAEAVEHITDTESATDDITCLLYTSCLSF